MLTPTALIVAVLVAAVGALVFWANPARMVNRLVLTSALHVAAWLACFHLTPNGGLIWLKITCAVGGAVPMHFWLVKETIASDLRVFTPGFIRRAALWLIPTLFVAIIPFTEAFIPSHSTSEHRLYGWGYYAYIAVDLVVYVYMLVDALRSTNRVTGGRQIELQVWLCGLCGTGVVILARMALRALVHNNSVTNLQPIGVLVCYAGAAYAITTHRVFDARQILLLALEKTLLVVTVAGAAFLVNAGLGEFFPPAMSLIVTTGAALMVATYANGKFDRLFKFYPDATVVRAAVFAAAQKETRVEELRQAFIAVLKGWGHSDHALILMGGSQSVRAGDIELAVGSPVCLGMHELRWVTPERLTRERRTVVREALAEFLREQRLGAMVIAEGPTLTVYIGVGVAASRRPFTYPQVTQLLEVASIMESALERALFSVKAQRAEQLATVGILGASLAHEIRNPLVTIKTFVQLLPNHYQDATFRTKFFGLIGEEVTRIDRLTEQLLDMASPHTYSAQSIELHPVLDAGIELVAPKAKGKQIEFMTDFHAAPGLAFTDPSAAKQVLLNLCLNAIQAVETQTGPRWVKVCTRNVPHGIEMIVEDSGPGIAPEIRPRLFQPFQTTKSSGFGLGLAICSDILAGLDATISVDPLVPGQGATFRVVFPCPA